MKQVKKAVALENFSFCENIKGKDKMVNVKEGDVWHVEFSTHQVKIKRYNNYGYLSRAFYNKRFRSIESQPYVKFSSPYYKIASEIANSCGTKNITVTWVAEYMEEWDKTAAKFRRYYNGK